MMEYKKICELAHVVTGNTPSTKIKDYYLHKDIAFFKPNDFSENRINELTMPTNWLSNTAEKIIRMLPAKSVLFTSIGIIGKIGILNVNATCNQQINAILPNEEFDERFIAYSLLSIKDNLIAKANSPVVPIINKTDFENTIIPYTADKKEQKQIVEVLDEINNAIEIKKKQLIKIFEYTNSLFNELQFSDDCLMPIEYIYNIIDGDRGNNYPTANDFFDKEHCLFLNAKNVTSNGFIFEKCNYITKEKDESLRGGKLQYGDLVLTTRGTLGNVALFDSTVKFDNVRINSGMVILRGKKDMNSTFCEFMIRKTIHEFLEKNKTGSAQPQIPLRDLKKYQIYVPPKRIQDNFAAKYTEINAIKDQINNEIVDLKILFDKKMQQYFG